MPTLPPLLFEDDALLQLHTSWVTLPLEGQPALKKDERGQTHIHGKPW